MDCLLFALSAMRGQREHDACAISKAMRRRIALPSPAVAERNEFVIRDSCFVISFSRSVRSASAALNRTFTKIVLTFFRVLQ
jgi:hypothetical protein